LYLHHIRNTFLHGDLQEEVYTTRPRFIRFEGNFESVLDSRRLFRVEVVSESLVWLVKYYRHIIWSEAVSLESFHLYTAVFYQYCHIDQLCWYCCQWWRFPGYYYHVVLPDHTLSYDGSWYHVLLSCDRSCSSKGLCFKKNIFLICWKNLIMLASKSVWHSNGCCIRIDQNMGNALDDLCHYHKLIEKLIYLTVTRPDITFVVSMLS